MRCVEGLHTAFVFSRVVDGLELPDEFEAAELLPGECIDAVLIKQAVGGVVRCGGEAHSREHQRSVRPNS
jgi:hypothetical protein